MSNSKFSGFFDAAKEEPKQSAETPAATHQPDKEKATPASRQPTAGITRGRPAIGKRSNPDYQQVSCFVRKDTYLEAQIKLKRLEKRQDFSDLVDELVSAWLQE